MTLKKGTVTFVAKTGGIKLDHKDTWYNPKKEIRNKISNALMGVEIEIDVDDNNIFILPNKEVELDIEEENVVEDTNITEDEKEIITEELKQKGIEVEFKSANEIESIPKEHYNYFRENAKVKVEIERKGKFNYSSWAEVWDKLKHNVPMATMKVYETADGLPYFKGENGVFVKVGVTCYGLELAQFHPVLDNFNKPILEPNVFQINTSIQRCLAKACALHGIGLYVYKGEDLPEEGTENVK